MEPRASLASRTFAELSGALVGDFDPVEVLAVLAERCAELLADCESVVMLADAEGVLHVAAASSEEPELEGLVGLQRDGGPAYDAFDQAVPVLGARVAHRSRRWPSFAGAAAAAGFPVVHAFPVRLRDRRLGALCVLSRSEIELADAEVELAQALADLTAVTILQEEAKAHAGALAGRLEETLRRRVAIEQAKGLLAEYLGVSPDAALASLRSYARRRARPLDEVARALATGDLEPASLHPGPPAPRDGEVDP